MNRLSPTMSRVLIAAAAVVLIGWIGILRPYGATRGELVADLGAARESVDGWDRALDQEDRLETRIGAFVAQTLGGDRETVDHRLRTRLNRLVEEIGLSDVNVGTGTATPRRSPARTSMSRRGTWARLRDAADFVELEAWVGGEGTFEQTLRLAHRVASDGWIKHIEVFRLDPVNGGESFTIDLRLRTIFLPGREPETLPWREADPAGFDRYAALVEAIPFRIPPPVVETAVVAEAPSNPVPGEPNPPRKFPYGQWLLTGVAEGPTGPETWLRNRQSGETRLLFIGDRLGDADLESVDGDLAQFRIGERRFQVLVGHSLGDRLVLDN